MIKKVLIISIIAFAVIGYLIKDIVDPKTALLSKLDKFAKSDNLYYEADIKYKHMGMVYNTITIKQYKNRDNYRAIMINPLSKEKTVFNVTEDNIRFLDKDVTYEGSREKSLIDKSIFWLDKIKSDDLNKDTIKKIQPSEEVITMGLKCTMYTAKLKDNNKNIDICIDNYIPVFIKYSKANDFLPALFNIKLNEYHKKSNGDVTIILKNIINNPKYDKSFDLPELTSEKPVDIRSIKNNILQKDAFMLINQGYNNVEAPSKKDEQ